MKYWIERTTTQRMLVEAPSREAVSAYADGDGFESWAAAVEAEEQHETTITPAGNHARLDLPAVDRTLDADGNEIDVEAAMPAATEANDGKDH